MRCYSCCRFAGAVGALIVAATTAWAAAAAAPGQLPLVFEPNQGPDAAPFVSRHGKANVRLSPGAFRLVAPGQQPITMRLAGGNPASALVPESPRPSYSSYYLGHDPSQWRTHVPHFGQIRYRDAYPGIDLVFHGRENELEYDFVLKPHADLRQITLQFSGAKSVKIASNGDLLLQTAQGELRQRAPVLYQEQTNGSRRPVRGRYIEKPGHRIGFQVARYNHALPLVIDPVLTYSSYLGASGASGSAAAIDSTSGNIYVAGAISGGYLNEDGYLAKFDSSGANLLVENYFGGDLYDEVTALAVDAAGNVYLAGNTNSDNFPVTSGSYQTARKGPAGINGFVVKLTSAGQMVYSTLLSGTIAQVLVNAIAVDAAGQAYVTGSTQASTSGDTFSTTPGVYQSVSKGGSDAFVIALNAAGSNALYATLLGGSGDDSAFGIVVDSHGNATVTGSTTPAATASDFPVTTGAVQTIHAGTGSDAFVAQLNAAGGALNFSTLLGGSAADSGRAIASDAAGNFYVTGSTVSSDFPTTPGVYAPTPGGSGFVAKLNPTGTSLVYSTYLNTASGNAPCAISSQASGCNTPAAIAVDAHGEAYVAGGTSDANFPTTAGALQRAVPDAQSAAFFLRVNPAAGAIDYATLFGGSTTYKPNSSSYTSAGAIALDNSGNVFLFGTTNSSNLPATANALHSHIPFPSLPILPDFYYSDAFLAKVSMQPGDCSVTLSPSSIAAPPGGLSPTISVTAPNGCPWVASRSAYALGAGSVGSGSVSLYIPENYTNTAKSYAYNIGGQTVSVTQPGYPCTYTFSPASLQAPQSGTSQTISIRTPTGCGYSVSSDSPWLAITYFSSANSTGPNSAQGDGFIYLAVSPNLTNATRTGTISAGGQSLTVSQAGACVLGLTPSLASLPGTGGTSTVALSAPADCSWIASADATWLTVSPTSGTGGTSLSITAAQNTGLARTANLSAGGKSLTLTQLAPAGFTSVVTDIGIFRPSGSGGVLWVRDRNGDGLFTGAPDTAVGVGVLGASGDIPLIGDWNGSGTKKLGVYRPASSPTPGLGLFVLDSNGDEQYTTGVDKAFWLQPLAGDVPVVGRWNGGTKDQIGIFRSGVWYLDVNGDGTFAKTVILGQSGDVPVVGDWNGSGTTKVGVFRNGLWILDYNGNGQWDGPSTDKFFYLGQTGDTPLVGDWNGSGTTKAGIFRNGLWVLDYNGNFQWDGIGADKALFNGVAGDLPVLGDWTGDGKMKAGVFHQGTWFLDVLGDGSFARLAFIGQSGDIPIAGKF